MPEISRFYGIVIKMFFDENNPPHFHAYYSGDNVLIDINTLSVFAGRFPAESSWTRHRMGDFSPAGVARELGKSPTP